MTDDEIKAALQSAELRVIGPDGKDQGPITGLVIKPGRKTFHQALMEALPPGCSIVARSV